MSARAGPRLPSKSKGPALKNAQMCIPAVAGHPGPLRGTLPSAGLVENIVPARICVEREEQMG